MTPRRASALAGVLLALGFVASGLLSQRLLHQRRLTASEEMLVALPLVPQLLMSGGDRYLAANLGTWRALVAVPERMSRQQFAVQGRLQKDVAWLNPRHEDNYWVAAAILPWNGQHPAAQEVLRAASIARPYDWQPQFYYAFGMYYFDRNPDAGAQWLHTAAQRLSDQDDHYMLESIAASWYEKRYAPLDAADYLEVMARQSRSSGFKLYLLRRVERLRALATLREAASRFQTLRGRPLRDVNELTAAGLVKSLPKDPFGFGFGIDPKGVVQFGENLGQERR